MPIKDYNLAAFAINVENFSMDLTTIDTAHMFLIFSTIIALKPYKLLELGVGKGYATQAILAGIKYNGVGSLTCVDNLADYCNAEPPFYADLRKQGAKIIAPVPEMSFVFSCPDKFDFIMSDADHEKSGLWVEMTNALLNPGGIMCFHDIGDVYPNSKMVLEMVEKHGYSKMLFNANTRPDERCERGFLIIKKDK
jgi:predicted O-methyltransferase YrrM